MKIGIVGTSWITENFILAATSTQLFQFEAVYSRSLAHGEAFARQFSIPQVYDDLQEMAKDSQIEAVYIASPNSLHYEQSKVFLLARKHVLCEKPMTISLQEQEELREIAQQRALIYLEALMMMHLPERLVLREAVGRIGTISLARFDYSQLSSKYPAYLRGELPNIFNPHFGTGCLMDLGVYCVYPAIDLFGAPEDVKASASFLESGSDCCGSALLQYKDKTVNLSYSKIGDGGLGSEIQGSLGTITIGSISRLETLKIRWHDGREEVLTGKKEKIALMAGEAKAFYYYIRKYSENRQDYTYMAQLSLTVSETLEKIRQESKIYFT